MVRAQADEVVAAVEGGAEGHVDPVGQVVEGGGGVPRTQGGEVGTDGEKRAVVQSERVRRGRGETLAEIGPLLREQVRTRGHQLSHLAQRIGGSEGDEGRAGRDLGRPPRGPRQQRGLQPRAALGAEQRLEAGLDLPGTRGPGHHQRRGSPRRHCSKRYTTPGGDSSTSSSCGSAARRTEAKVAVLSPISRISSSTGVCSATPLA